MLTGRRHRGAALLAFVATMLLLAGGICTAAIHFLLTGRQLASQQLDREIAFRAAEAALHDAESDLLAAATAGGARLSAWPGRGTCGTGAQAGLCHAEGDRRHWQPWLDGAAVDGLGVPLGAFTGAQLPALPDDVIGATALPRYLVELRDGVDAAAGIWPRMTVTAVGFGRDPAVRVVLQTEFQP
ncbi:pilus assembly PilX family protein [Cupriavidus agavae]|uniref:Tfp pilus assembly protein PilX n=1 Tax=Cupriavidus agavae TaxID=1001822 RepID=A0A4V2FHT4_9BURK|nr:pilus assembly protein PilX [Cupriavidus agavae]RZT41389.1 Tfp pilus assembly protein PilX [Cupriavidus agavae]